MSQYWDLVTQIRLSPSLSVSKVPRLCLLQSTDNYRVTVRIMSRVMRISVVPWSAGAQLQFGVDSAGVIVLCNCAAINIIGCLGVSITILGSNRNIKGLLNQKLCSLFSVKTQPVLLFSTNVLDIIVLICVWVSTAQLSQHYICGIK